MMHTQPFVSEPQAVKLVVWINLGFSEVGGDKQTKGQPPQTP